MLNNKQVLVSGCSFSRGPGSWPYQLQNRLNFNLVNLALAGAGNTYIHNSIICELAKRKYDLVLIMWSGLERVDCQVTDIGLFKDTPYTSNYQSELNDWPEKVVVPINDQDYVGKNWVFGSGAINSDPMLRKINFLESQYKYMGIDEFTTQSLIYMISLQAILKQLNIHYVFSFYQNYQLILKNHYLYEFLDIDNIFNDQNISDITKQNNWYDIDGCHPSSEAHRNWAHLLQEFLLNKYAKN